MDKTSKGGILPPAYKVSVNTGLRATECRPYIANMFLGDVYRKLDDAERSIRSGDVIDGFDSLKAIREKHGL